MNNLSIAARIVEFIVVCGSFGGGAIAVINWAIKNAKNADDIPKLRSEVENFTRIIRSEIEALKIIVLKTDGSTIADHTDILQTKIDIEKKNGRHSTSYMANRSLS